MPATTKTTDGSYGFNRFSTISQELEKDRLHHQGTLLLNLEAKIWQDAGLQDGMQIVDLGCGTGTISCAIALKFPNAHIWGIDPSHHLLNTARQLQEQQHLTNVQFSLGDAYALNFPNASIDFVYGRLLFQHLAKPIKALKEIARVLKPGGKVCVVDVADGWFALNPEPPAFSRLRERLGTIQVSQGGDSQVGYKLGSYLSEAGFKQIETKVEVVTSDRLGGIEQFLGLFSFGSPYSALDPDLEALALSAREATAQLSHQAHAWGAFGLFVTTGLTFYPSSVTLRRVE
jgi:ubiquinone/menaquinone biosynthesis C-methylase UbiE